MSFISYAQNYEDVILYRAFKDLRNGTYIDVGAYDPEVDSVTKLFYDRGWRGINIEPVEAGFKKLCQERPDDINLQIAVGDTEGKVDFYDVVGTGLSTLEKSIAERHARDQGYKIKRRKVPIAKLSTVLDEHPLPEVHFLKIDVEGFEGQVLQGLDLQKTRPWICIVESTRPNLQEESFDSWEPILLSAGYEFAYFDGLNRFYLASEHLELQKALSTPPNVFDDFNLSGAGNSPLHYQLAKIQASLTTAREKSEALETARSEAEARQSDMQVQVAKALENAIQQDELLRERDRILGETTSRLKESQEFLRVKEQELEQATATLLESKGLLGAKEQELEQATATLLEQQALLRDGEHKQRETLESLEIEKAHRQKKKAELLAVHRALSRTDLELRGTLDELQQLRQSSVHLKSETDKRIDQLENALCMTTLELEQNRTELLNVYASKSWKITRPLRKAQDAAKWVVKWPAKLLATHRKAVDNDGHSPTNPETPVQDVSPNQNSEHVTPRAHATDKIVVPEATINMFMARIQAELELRDERMEDPDREISA